LEEYLVATTQMFVCNYCFAEFEQFDPQQQLCPDCVREVEEKNRKVGVVGPTDGIELNFTLADRIPVYSMPTRGCEGQCQKELPLSEFYAEVSDGERVKLDLGYIRPEELPPGGAYRACKRCTHFTTNESPGKFAYTKPKTSSSTESSRMQYNTPFRRAGKLSVSKCEEILDSQRDKCHTCREPITWDNKRPVIHRLGNEVVVICNKCYRKLKEEAKSLGINTRKAVWE
jgi:uncharacterized protein with PIN domain